ncbi:MAG: DUF3592 domain-containing protein [Pseudomonadota bacterium]
MLMRLLFLTIIASAVALSAGLPGLVIVAFATGYLLPSVDRRGQGRFNIEAVGASGWLANPLIIGATAFLYVDGDWHAALANALSPIMATTLVFAPSELRTVVTNGYDAASPAAQEYMVVHALALVCALILLIGAAARAPFGVDGARYAGTGRFTITLMNLAVVATALGVTQIITVDALAGVHTFLGGIKSGLSLIVYYIAPPLLAALIIFFGVASGVSVRGDWLGETRAEREAHRAAQDPIDRLVAEEFSSSPLWDALIQFLYGFRWNLGTLCFIAFTGGAIQAVTEIRHNLLSEHTTATITAIDERTAGSGKLIRAPVVRFRTTSGTEVEARGALPISRRWTGRDHGPFKIGDEVAVQYRPEDPNAVRVGEFPQRSVTAALWLGVAFFISLFNRAVRRRALWIAGRDLLLRKRAELSRMV